MFWYILEGPGDNAPSYLCFCVSICGKITFMIIFDQLTPKDVDFIIIFLHF